MLPGFSVSVDVSPERPAPHLLRYQIDFDGDGKDDYRGTDPHARFTYEDVGTYTIRVKVYDDVLKSSTTLARKVRVH